MNGPKPWSLPYWLWDRIKEAVWQGFSWSYFFSITMTVNFLIRQTELSAVVMLLAWGGALSIRFIASPLAEAKSAQMSPSPPAPPPIQKGSP